MRPSDPDLGNRLGPYVLKEVLGEGAVGVVYLAERQPGGGLVALKVLRPELTGDETYRRRFAHEARAAREVEPRHLVPIDDAGELDGRLFVAFRYVPGRSLDQRLAEASGGLEVDGAVRVVTDVAAGLDVLHRHGLLHRDVKPSNVLVEESGRAWLTDFGLAKGPAYTALTGPGELVGTLDYLAPEIILGKPAGPPADVYALGCLAFECFAGSPPFGDRNMLDMVRAHVDEPPPDPLRERPDLPTKLSWALLRALEKDPSDRPPSATAYAHMVRLAAQR
jgi:serine/threonine protein kinase